MLTPEQQEPVYTKAGVAPAAKAAFKSAKLPQPDPFFGGQKSSEVFEKAMAAATPFPYAAGWPDIDQGITKAIVSAIKGRETPKGMLEDVVKETDETLRQWRGGRRGAAITHGCDRVAAGETRVTLRTRALGLPQGETQSERDDKMVDTANAVVKNEVASAGSDANARSRKVTSERRSSTKKSPMERR